MTDIEVRAEKRIEHAGTIMLLDFPWFGTLYMKLDKVARWDIPTMAVDGTSLFYNPEFTLTLPDNELLGVLAHETMHCALLHMYRRRARNPERWNIACVEPYAMISMVDGSLKPICKILPGEYVLSPCGPSRVIGLLSPGIKETLELYVLDPCYNGFSLRCSADHKLLTDYGFIDAKSFHNALYGRFLRETALKAIYSRQSYSNEYEDIIAGNSGFLRLDIGISAGVRTNRQTGAAEPQAGESRANLQDDGYGASISSWIDRWRGNNHYRQAREISSTASCDNEYVLQTKTVPGGPRFQSSSGAQQFQKELLEITHNWLSNRYTHSLSDAVSYYQKTTLPASLALYRHTQTAEISRSTDLRNGGYSSENQGLEPTRIQIRTGSERILRVFDLVTEHHTYFANGILVHNCDFVINADLIKAGFILPKDCLYDVKYLGLAAETVYAQLPDNPPDNGQGNKPLSTGTVMDAPSTPQVQSGKSDISNHATPGSGAPTNAQTSGKGNSLTAEDWAIAVEQATNATNKAGKTPCDASRSAKQARESQEDWREELREFISHVQPSDYSWASPNRRYIADGLYLPGIVKENMGSIGLCMDTSGSISAKVFDIYVSELKALLSEAQPESVIVAYADTKVRNVQTFFPDDLEIKLEARGGGGTRFQPALDYFGALDNPPACLIYFTDLDNGAEKLVEPDYPVLWVTGKAVTRIGKFGRTLQVDGF